MNGQISSQCFRSATAYVQPDVYRVDAFDPALHLYLQHLFDGVREERLYVIYCDVRRRYLHDEMLMRGTIHRIVARIRPLFARALALGAGGVLLAHNHLSGDCRPSEEDIRSTRHLQEVAHALEIELLDHLIFAPRRCFSMATGGYL